MLSYRIATLEDAPLLAKMNGQLLVDEGHRLRLTGPELEDRMRAWLQGEYKAAIFSHDEVNIGYALIRHDPGWLYLRQFLIAPDYRRRGHGAALAER